jgi:hypothetical protein
VLNHRFFKLIRSVIIKTNCTIQIKNFTNLLSCRLCKYCCDLHATLARLSVRLKIRHITDTKILIFVIKTSLSANVCGKSQILPTCQCQMTKYFACRVCVCCLSLGQNNIIHYFIIDFSAWHRLRCQGNRAQ